MNGDIRIPPGAGRVHTGNGIANTIWTNDIMADAEAMPESTVKFFFGNGADYTDASNLPAAGYAYGTFLVMKRTINYAVIYALGGSGSAAGRLATRSKRSGSWGDWITY